MGRFRRLVAVGAVGVLITAIGACSSEDEAAEVEPDVGAAVYFGAVGMSGDRIAFDLAKPDAAGAQRVTAFITDGTPEGDAEWFEGTSTEGALALTSVTGKAHLEGTIEPAELHGTITLADGVERHFHTIPATHGAGIYDVTVSPDGVLSGNSESGAQLVGRQNGVFVEGAITTPQGDKIDFRDADLTRAFRFPTAGNQPGRYTVVVSRHGLTLTGRGGDVAHGQPDANVINLDLGKSAVNTPGVWYGKVSGGTDQFVIVLGEPDPAGVRRIRMYLSDGEPEPEGDTEWFVGDFTGDIFNLTSASKNAAVIGKVWPEFVAGELTFAGQPGRPIFAVPAGDGAGIYEVTVSPEKQYQGTSEQGGRFTLRQEGDNVNGTITTPEGRDVPLTAYDLTRVFDYSVEGSAPDTYVAFASPSGRYLMGRNGDVRGGTAGTNIIGLDKAC